MPDDARTLERADAEGWPPGRSPRAEGRAGGRRRTGAGVPPRAGRGRCEGRGRIFPVGRPSVRRARPGGGAGDEPSVERLVTQICYRAADLAFLLDREGEPLSRYSRDLRTEPGVTDSNGDLDEPQGGP